MAELNYTNTEKAFDRFFTDVIKKSKDNLKKGGNIASKDLYNSLDYNFKENKNSIEADFLMEDYGDFIDKGVKGIKEGRSLAGYKYTNKKPPVRFLRTWLKRKTKKFRKRNLNNIAFAIQNTIYLKGIKPTQFFSKPFEEEFRNLPNEVVEAYGLDIESFMELVLNKN